MLIEAQFVFVSRRKERQKKRNRIERRKKSNRKKDMTNGRKD